MRHLASNIAFLQALRSYSYSAENEWFKFISHKKKIVSSIEEVERGEDRRSGISFLIDRPETQSQKSAQSIAYDQSVVYKRPQPSPPRATEKFPRMQQPTIQRPIIQRPMIFSMGESSSMDVDYSPPTNHRPSIFAGLPQWQVEHQRSPSTTYSTTSSHPRSSPRSEMMSMT